MGIILKYLHILHIFYMKRNCDFHSSGKDIHQYLHMFFLTFLTLISVLLWSARWRDANTPAQSADCSREGLIKQSPMRDAQQEWTNLTLLSWLLQKSTGWHTHMQTHTQSMLSVCVSIWKERELDSYVSCMFCQRTIGLIHKVFLRYIFFLKPTYAVFTILKFTNVFLFRICS